MDTHGKIKTRGDLKWWCLKYSRNPSYNATSSQNKARGGLESMGDLGSVVAQKTSISIGSASINIKASRL